MLKKQIGGVIFTLFYLVTLFKPLLPDIVYYANYDYIVTELCVNKDKPELQCNGRCYLNALKKRITPLTEDKPVTTAPLSLSDYPIFPLDSYIYKISEYKEVKKSTTPNYNKHFVISEYSSSIFHPPKTMI